MMFLDCPAYLDAEETVRCGLPAELSCRHIMRSSDGPLESAMIRCPVGHWFNGPVECLTRDSRQDHDRSTAGARSSARRDGLMGGHDGRDGSGFAVQDFPAWYICRAVRGGPAAFRRAGPSECFFRMSW